jgi:hypothetical protein
MGCEALPIEYYESLDSEKRLKLKYSFRYTAKDIKYKYGLYVHSDYSFELRKGNVKEKWNLPGTNGKDMMVLENSGTINY